MSEEKVIETDVKQENVTKDENNVPISRLNEVISERNDLRDKMKAFEQQQEEQKRAKLKEEEKWQELNVELNKEIETYKPYKEKWELMDLKLRKDALAKLPESKREKFSNVDTETLLNIVSEFGESKENPPDRKGTVPTRNWSKILESYRR